MGWGFFPSIFRDEKFFTLFESTNEAVSENRFFLEVESVMSVSEIMNFEKKKLPPAETTRVRSILSKNRLCIAIRKNPEQLFFGHTGIFHHKTHKKKCSHFRFQYTAIS